VGEMHSVMRGPKPLWCNDGVIRNDRGLLDYTEDLVPEQPEAANYPLAAATNSSLNLNLSLSLSLDRSLSLNLRTQALTLRPSLMFRSRLSLTRSPRSRRRFRSRLHSRATSSGVQRTISSPLSRRLTTKQSSPSSSTCPLSCALLASTSTFAPRIYQVCEHHLGCHRPDCYFALRRDTHHVDLKSVTCSCWARNRCKDGDNRRYKHSRSLYRNGSPGAREIIKMTPPLDRYAPSVWTVRAFVPASPHDGQSPGSGSRCPRNVSFVFRNFTGLSSFHSISIAYIFTYTTRSLRRTSLSWELWKPGRRIPQLHRQAQHPHPMLESHRRAKIRGSMILRGSKPRRRPVQLHTGRHQPFSTDLHGCEPATKKADLPPSRQTQSVRLTAPQSGLSWDSS
jgi:hypothetical protein